MVFGDDWRGVFFRGDLCNLHTNRLLSIAEELENHPELHEHIYYLVALHTAFAMTNEHKFPHVVTQKLKPYEECLKE